MCFIWRDPTEKRLLDHLEIMSPNPDATPSVAQSQKNVIGRAFWMGGTSSLSAVNHTNTGRSQASLSSCMRNRVDSACLRGCSIFPCDAAGALAGFTCLRGEAH